MKKLLTIAVLIITANLSAQVFPNQTNNMLNIVIRDLESEKDSYLIEESDGKLVIKGDSLAVIKMLLKNFKEQLDKKNIAEDCVSKAVKYSNTTPDYLKKSKEWKEYQWYLKKMGYKTAVRVK